MSFARLPLECARRVSGARHDGIFNRSGPLNRFLEVGVLGLVLRKRSGGGAPPGSSSSSNAWLAEEEDHSPQCFLPSPPGTAMEVSKSGSRIRKALKYNPGDEETQPPLRQIFTACLRLRPSGATSKDQRALVRIPADRNWLRNLSVANRVRGSAAPTSIRSPRFPLTPQTLSR